MTEALTAARQRGDVLVGSMLLHTELFGAAQRRGLDTSQALGLLDGIHLVDVGREDFLRTTSSSWGLRSADALHLAIVLRLTADRLITYDHEMHVAAERAGVHVDAPE